jgi:hypothetical protein
MAKRIGGWLLVAAAGLFAAFNIYMIVRSLETGTVPPLYRASGTLVHDTIFYATEPDMFVWNLLGRALMALLSGGYAVKFALDAWRGADSD